MYTPGGGGGGGGGGGLQQAMCSYKNYLWNQNAAKHKKDLNFCAQMT